VAGEEARVAAVSQAAIARALTAMGPAQRASALANMGPGAATAAVASLAPAQAAALLSPLPPDQVMPLLLRCDLGFMLSTLAAADAFAVAGWLGDAAPSGAHPRGTLLLSLPSDTAAAALAAMPAPPRADALADAFAASRDPDGPGGGAPAFAQLRDALQRQLPGALPEEWAPLELAGPAFVGRAAVAEEDAGSEAPSLHGGETEVEVGAWYEASPGEWVRRTE